MYGPMPEGHWASGRAGNPDTYNGLRRGRQYQVAQAFRDFDGDDHPVGETWVFLGHNYVPYHDGLSLFVSLDGRQEWQIRMSCAPEDQGSIVGALDRYVVPVVSLSKG